MPIYEYLCSGCGKVNEKLQKVNDPAPARCEECGSKKLAKLVSRSAFQLKGGGWYSDLYASAKKEAPPKEGAEPKGDAKADAKADAKTDAKTEAKADAKSDAKPEAKAETKPAAAEAPAKAPAAGGAGKKGRKKGG
jgi:putative FmdB family regulatory protein